jgi:DNA-binding SARP family transcriptional activator/predicted ATPase
VPHLRLYGYPVLIDSAGTAVQFQSRKQLALLVYLALEARSQTVPRDRLMALLWGEVPERRARRSLYQALSVLRRRLGRDALPHRDPAVALRQDLLTDIDILRSGPGLPEGDLSAPLQGFEHLGSSAFEQWLDVARESLRRIACEGLLWRLNAARRAGEAMQVHERAAQLYRVDPLSEPAVQALCEQLLLDGDNVGAARLLRDHLARLEAETGVAAGPLLQRLLQLVEKGHLATRHVDVTAPRASRHRRPEAFIGRRLELGALEQKWGEVLTGRRRTCLVAGPAGIGKSSVLMRFSTSIAARAAAVWEVSCQEIGSNIPFAAVSDLIAALGRYPAASGADARWLSEAARVAPALRARYPGIPEPPPVPAEAVRLRLAEALVRIIEVVAEDGPMLLVLDDLAYLDPASRDILHLLLHRLEQTPILVAASARTTDEQGLVVTHHASGVGVAWDAVLPLQPLDREEVRSMIAELCGVHRPDEAVLAALVDLAQGNPYLVEMLLSDWQRHPQDSLVAARCAGDETAARWCPPNWLHRVFARQHRGLSSTADRMLCLLAVAGRKLSAGDLGRLLGLDGAASDAAALELLDRGVVRIEDGGLSFKNQLHRSFAYGTMGDERRKFLHGQVGGDLEGSGSATAFQDILAASHHFAEAGMIGRAIQAVKAGSHLAIERGAAREAERALRRLVVKLPPTGKPVVGLLLARSLAAQGRHSEGLAWLNKIDDCALSRTERASAALTRAESLHRARLETDEQIEEAIQSALNLALADGDDTQQLQALQLRAEFSCEGGETLSQDVQTAHQIAERATTDAVQALARFTTGYCMLVSGEVLKSGREFAAAARTFRQTSRELELRRALNGLAIHSMAIGNSDEAAELFREAAGIAERTGDLDGAANSWSNLGALRDDMGMPLAAARCYEHAIQHAANTANQRRFAELAINIAGLAMTLGEFDGADLLLGAASRFASNTSHWRLRTDALLARADLAIARGAEAEAWSLIEESDAIRSGRIYPLSDMGRFERLHRHHIWSTEGFAALERRAAEVTLARRCPLIGDQLEVKAFLDWVAWSEGQPHPRDGFALHTLVNMGLKGVAAWLYRLGAVSPEASTAIPRGLKGLLPETSDFSAATAKCLSLVEQLRSDRMRLPIQDQIECQHNAEPLQ